MPLDINFLFDHDCSFICEKPLLSYPKINFEVLNFCLGRGIFYIMRNVIFIESFFIFSMLGSA